MSAVTLVFAATALLYAAACTLFFVHLARGNATAAHWASRALGVAIAAHVGYLGCDYLLLGNTPMADIYDALAVLSLLIALAYLITMRRHRLTVLGAFVAPVTLLLLLASGLRGSVPPGPEGVRSALLPLHVAVNLLGIAAFALEFAAALG